MNAFDSTATLDWLRQAPQGIAARRPAQPRLGVLSATFNPPTAAHLALAEAAAAHAGLDEVLFVLPRVPPHKRELEASLEDRAEMLRLAVQDDPRFSAAIAPRGLLLEIHEDLAPHYPPATEFFFLTGSDAARRILLDWPYEDPQRAVRTMLERFQFIVAGRGEPFHAPPGSLLERYAARIHSVELPSETRGISSTQVRQRLGRGESVEGLVPAAVAAYIAQRGLYSAGPKSG